ncbi:MAG: hypothetical protein JSS81_19420 [Acidobacteria bacterium]|nr:hypothetical protein [Acidobacteriota bacterium]
MTEIPAAVCGFRQTTGESRIFDPATAAAETPTFFQPRGIRFLVCEIDYLIREIEFRDSNS